MPRRSKAIHDYKLRWRNSDGLDSGKSQWDHLDDEPGELTERQRQEAEESRKRIELLKEIGDHRTVDSIVGVSRCGPQKKGE